MWSTINNAQGGVEHDPRPQENKELNWNQTANSVVEQVIGLFRTKGFPETKSVAEQGKNRQLWNKYISQAVAEQGKWLLRNRYAFLQIF